MSETRKTQTQNEGPAKRFILALRFEILREEIRCFSKL